MDTTQTATKYQTYSKYKPSGLPAEAPAKAGIDWLGDIPEGWEFWKVSHLFNKIGSGTTPPSENTDYYDGDIPWVITGELKDNEIFDSENKVTKKAVQELSALKIFTKNSLLIAMYGATIGKMAILRIPSTTNQACCVLGDSKLIDVDFAFYYFLAFRPHLIALSYGGGQPNISKDTIRSIKIFLPEFIKQKEIVAFLDLETAKIDEMVVKKKKMIELLKEKRQALITHAVTKGLDPKAKMKLSSIDGSTSLTTSWLGDIPEGWEVKRLRFVIKTNPSKQEIKLNSSEVEVSFIPMESVSEDGEIDLTTTKLIEDVIDGYTYFRDGDVVIAKITPCFENGKGAIMHGLTNGMGFGTTEFHVLRSKDINSKYLYLITRIYPFRAFGEVNMKGAAGQKRVPEEFIKDFPIGLPKIDVQKEIVAFLDSETEKIDEVMKKVETQIEKLREYRQALITSAVTGKIMV